jgi:hypothetical protein
VNHGAARPQAGHSTAAASRDLPHLWQDLPSWSSIGPIVSQMRPLLNAAMIFDYVRRFENLATAFSADEFHSEFRRWSFAGLLMKRIVWIRPSRMSNTATCTRADGRRRGISVRRVPVDGGLLRPAAGA